MSDEEICTIDLNRFHRLSLWCRDCNNYWQLPNYLVVLHGTYNRPMLKRLLDINLYLYNRLLRIDCDNEYFGASYNFEDEVRCVFADVQQRLKRQPREIRVLDVDVISCLEENMTGLVDFILQMKGTFDMMAYKVLEHSPRNFVSKLGVLKKNIINALTDNNIKRALDNLMDLNIAGFDILVQCVGIILNCIYMVGIEVCDPDVKTPGVMYCKDPGVIIERLANISAQHFLYKHKRRWLVYYREVLNDAKSLFSDQKLYEQLRLCGNYETIERALYDVVVAKNPELLKHLTILKHSDKYPKSAHEIYEWWSGRSKEQLQKIFGAVDSCLVMDSKSSLFPFILTYKSHAKDRMFYDILHMLHIFDHINPELSTAINFTLRIYPEVFEQVYFPDRDKYVSCDAMSTPEHHDVLDNVRDKNTLRRCDNPKCQERNKGKNVVWNLNTFEAGSHSMNTIFKEVIKNPKIFEELFAYAQKNLKIAINANSITAKKPKIIYK